MTRAGRRQEQAEDGELRKAEDAMLASLTPLEREVMRQRFGVASDDGVGSSEPQPKPSEGKSNVPEE